MGVSSPETSRGDVFEEAGIDILLAMTVIEQNFQIVCGGVKQLGSIGLVIGIVELTPFHSSCLYNRLHSL